MTPQELKNSILQLAIQGKLVEQRPEEGTAEELFAQIQAEKRRLVKEGKIKKEKPLPEITEEEKPFEIPESWMWERIGEIFGLQAGKNITSANIYEEKSEQHPYQCFGGNGIRGFVATYNREGHFALIGRQGALCGNINLASGKFYATEHAVVVDHYSMTDVLWSAWFLKALNLNQYATATAQPGLAVANIVKVLIPLPPLAEQKRIVAKIEELLPLVDRYEQAWSKMEQFNSRFPEDMKKSLLQQAIQGKLVEQRPEEGTAEELFAQIQAEKRRLIKAGKIKKEKPLPEITEEEKPFDIPESWMWVRWGDLSQSIQYGYNAPAQESGRIKMVRISDIQGGKVLWDSVPYCEIKEDDISTYLLGANDILFARTGGTVGKSYLVREVPEEAIYAGYLIRTRYSSLLCPEYLKYYMESQLYWGQLRNGTIATAQPNCNGKTLSKMVLPLPPLAEQKRIVEKLEQLLPLCERLKGGI